MQVGLGRAGHRWERIKRPSVVTDRHGLVVEPLASVVLQVCRCNGEGGGKVSYTLRLDSSLDEMHQGGCGNLELRPFQLQRPTATIIYLSYFC